MSKLQLLRLFLNERLTAAAVEIFGAVEKTVAEYQEENYRLRRLLRITPDIKPCKIARIISIYSALKLQTAVITLLVTILLRHKSSFVVCFYLVTK